MGCIVRLMVLVGAFMIHPGLGVIVLACYVYEVVGED